MSLHRIVYCSRNCTPGTLETVTAEIAAILEASRRNNARDGVTGGLLFSQDCFAQVLEGPIDAVEAAFERIQCDERHGEVTVLESGPVVGRDFPDWSMAFTGAQTDSPLAGIAMDGAFSRRTGAADVVLDLLRGVVKRETEWLSAA